MDHLVTISSSERKFVLELFSCARRKVSCSDMVTNILNQYCVPEAGDSRLPSFLGQQEKGQSDLCEPAGCVPPIPSWIPKKIMHLVHHQHGKVSAAKSN